MEMTTLDTKKMKAEAAPNSNLSFENTEIAFSSKTDKQLRKAHLLFKMIGNNFLMKFGQKATMAVLALRLPVKGIIKATIFEQFCGGEDIAECASTTKELDKYNIGTILDYSVEGKNSERDYRATTDELHRTLKVAENNIHIPFCVFKVSGLCSNALLEKISSKKPLKEKEIEDQKRLEERVNTLCKNAWESGTPIFIDAEETWIQDAIDDLAFRMMLRYNKEKAVVYNTLQMYRHDRLQHLKKMHANCKAKGIVYAVKLVRGAYMEKERERAEDKGYPSPIQPNKKATDRDFDLALKYALDNYTEIAICAGTHNEESSMLLAKEMTKRNIPKNHPHIYFAQLYGMSDHISFNLSDAGFNVAKYVPYGPVREVMPYLMRRAEENTSVAGQTSRELRLIESEIKRRKTRGNRS
jgi:proline dehydrogenase